MNERLREEIRRSGYCPDCFGALYFGAIVCTCDDEPTMIDVTPKPLWVAVKELFAKPAR